MVRILALTILLGLTLSAFGQIELKNDKIGIGTLNPQFDVHLKADMYQFQNKTGIDLLQIRDDGHVGIGTTILTRKFQVEESGTTTTSAFLRPDISSNNDYSHVAVGKATSTNKGALFGYLYKTTETNSSAFISMWGDVPSSGTGLFVKKGGNVGIGTTTPTSKFHIKDSNSNFEYFGDTNGNSYIRVNNALRLRLSGSSTNRVVFGFYNSYFLSNVGIGTTSPSEKLHVNGNIFHSGTISGSDKRLKKNISPFGYGLNELLQLSPIHYTYNGKGGTHEGSSHIGIIAQELQEVVPDLVKEYEHVEYNEQTTSDAKSIKSKESYLAIKDNEIKYLMINAIKEQQVLIENQQAQINELKELIERGQIEQFENTLINKIEIALENSGKEELPYLAQNIPNPTRDATIVKYFIPASATSAIVRFFSLSGQILDEVKIDQTGQGEIKVDLEKMRSGNYMYALIVDGELIDTKTMAIAK